MTDQVKPKISLRSVIFLAIGLFAGFVLAMVIPKLTNQTDERVASYEEVATAQAVLEAAEVLANQPIPSNAIAQVANQLPADGFDGAGLAASMPIDTTELRLSWMQSNRTEDPTFLEQRWALAQDYILSKELKSEADVRAFLLTPREYFVRDPNRGYEYADTWLQIGYGATITDPDVVAMMTSTLQIQPGERVLEIGTGSGYQSAFLSSLTDQVYTIEIIRPLQAETEELLTRLSEAYPAYNNIHRRLGDGYYGWEDSAPFNKIIVTCSIDHIPPPLLRQLAPNGIMVLPLGPPGRQFIMEVKKTANADGTFSLARRDVYNGLGVRFIPFLDETGKSYSGSGTEGGE